MKAWKQKSINVVASDATKAVKSGIKNKQH